MPLNNNHEGTETDRDKATSTPETIAPEHDALHSPFILSNTSLPATSLSTSCETSPFIFLIQILNNNAAHHGLKTTSLSSTSIQILPTSRLLLPSPHRQLTTCRMCHISIFWHNCDHLIPMTLTCPFQDLLSHTTEPTSTALLGDPCPLCRQAYPPNKHTLTTQQSLLTAQTLASVLNVSVSQPGFLDMVARFFARGDHKRFDQPGPEKAAYDEKDEYLDALAEESRLAVEALGLDSYLDLDLDDLCNLTAASNGDPEGHDGHAESDMSTATIASWDGLNWEGRNLHPSPGFYYYSTGSASGSGSTTETEQAPTPTIAPQQLLAAGLSSDGSEDGNWDWNVPPDPLQVPDLVPYTPVPITIPIAMGHGSSCAVAGTGRNRRGESMDPSFAHAPPKTLEMPRAMLVRRITQRRNGKKRQQVVSIGKSPLGRGDRQRRRDKREE